MATRPATLPAAVVPVLVGTAAALARGYFHPGVLVAATISSLLIQIGTNLANDLFDYLNGADTAGRTGPTRVTQAGLLTPQQVAAATVLSYCLAIAVGMYLVAIGGWPILVIGLTGIASGILYSGGPWPLGYHGLGDLFVFIFFGVVAVTGTYYLHTGVVELSCFALSLPVATIVTALLVVNNLRDIETDRVSGKYTLAVLLGAAATRWQYALLVGIAYVVPLFIWLTGSRPMNLWLPLLSAPLAYRLARAVLTGTNGPALNQVLKGTGRLHLVYGTLYALSLLTP